MPTSQPTHYFARTGGSTFAPTSAAEGAWSPEDHHFAPLAGLVVHEIERSRPDGGSHGGGMALSRISFDILGRLPLHEVEVRTEVLRPGRTIELVQATAAIDGRDAVVARAWYLAGSDTSDVAGDELGRLPAPGDCPERPMSEVWPGGYIGQLSGRQALDYRPGRAAMWITSPARLVEGEEPVGVAEFLARADTANGVAVRKGPRRWAYPNVDLTVHLTRIPDPAWTGLDTSVTWGAGGVGLTSSVLHDVHGPVGRAEQCLTLRRLGEG